MRVNYVSNDLSIDIKQYKNVFNFLGAYNDNVNALTVVNEDLPVIEKLTICQMTSYIYQCQKNDCGNIILLAPFNQNAMEYIEKYCSKSSIELVFFGPGHEDASSLHEMRQ